MVWDLLSKTTTVKCHDHTNAVSCVTFDKEERILASCSWDKSIRMMDISTGEFRGKGLNNDFEEVILYVVGDPPSPPNCFRCRQGLGFAFRNYNS